MPPTLTTDARWRALANGPANDPDARTRQELCALFGLKSTQMKIRLAALVQAGRVRVTTKRVVRADGRVHPMTAYVLLDTATKFQQATEE